MKRDMDLIRKILRWAIEKPPSDKSNNPSFEGCTKEQISYHVWLMKQAGLVDAGNVRTIHSSGPEGLLYSVTYAGHEVAQKVADDTFWKKAKGTTANPKEECPIEFFKEMINS